MDDSNFYFDVVFCMKWHNLGIFGVRCKNKNVIVIAKTRSKIKGIENTMKQ